MGQAVRTVVVALTLALIGVCVAGRAVAASPQGPADDVNACSTEPGGLSKVDAFERNLRKFHVDLFGVAFVASENVQTDLGEADLWAKQNTARMIQEAQAALASVKDYRARLDTVGLDFDALQRSSRITSKRGVASLITAALAQMDAGISKLYQAGSHWEAAANGFLAYNYDAAHDGMENGATAWGDGVLGIQAGELKVAAAMAALFEASPCKDVADVTSPLSAGQISGRSGGGGTQSRRGTDLSVIAPKRLKLSRRGATRLLMTVTASKAGIVEVWLKRRGTLILNIHVGARRPGKFGLTLKLPPTTSTRDLKLTLSFISGKVNPLTTLNLTTKVSRP